MWTLNGVEFDEFCRELMEVRKPFRMDIMIRLCGGSNEYGVGWKNHCLLVNGNEYKMIMDYMKEWRYQEIMYNKVLDRIEIVKNINAKEAFLTDGIFYEDFDDDANNDSQYEKKHKNDQNAQSTLMKTILTDFENYSKVPTEYKQKKNEE